MKLTFRHALIAGLICQFVLAERCCRADGDPPPSFATQITPLVKKYCVECHQGAAPEAGVSFEKMIDEKSLFNQRKTWERVFEVLTQGTMPPAENTQPTADEKQRALQFLDLKLHHIDCASMGDPGRVTIRRLNRAEYNNTIRDLMGVAFRPADDFPSDDVGYGFDNIGDVLSLPPLLMEKYLNAAEKIAREAVLTDDPSKPQTWEFERQNLKLSRTAHRRGEHGLILVSNGDITAIHPFPKSGQYLFKVIAAETPAGDEATKMDFRLDGNVIGEYSVNQAEPNYGTFEVSAHVEKGTRKFSIEFLNDFYDEKAPDKNRRDRNLLIRDIKIIGPTAIDADQYPTFHRQYLVAAPGDGKSVVDAARENLRPFLRRAFRHPVTDEDVNRFAGIVDRLTAKGEMFATGMQVAVMGALVSPQFLFRIESDRNPNDPGDRHPLNDFELASRLSYFLWSSMPDEELFAHAERGDLHTDAVIEHQVKRMLADPKSQALVDNFAEQWLQLRILNDVQPDPQKFPEFNAELREDLKQETRRFFLHVVREDRSVLDFLDGRYTFVNERLARHYGLNGVSGNEFRLVSLEGKGRAGLLTQGSILTLTSNPDRTSPVKRGKWVMEVLLNQPPPPPPPNAPQLAETAKARPEMTLRQQLELHRQNAACASCHRVMDQLGFGIENFDAIGRWRDKDGQQPLDTRGDIPGGGSFNGPIELASVLRKKQRDFSESLTEKLLTYALGRGLEFYDQCATDRIIQTLMERDFKFSVLVTEIAKSEPFRMRRGEEAK